MNYIFIYFVHIGVMTTLGFFVVRETKLKIFIKYMVSNRCKMLVKRELDTLGIFYRSIELGEVEIKKPLDPAVLFALKNVLLTAGLEVLESKKAILIARIKNAVIDLVHYSSDEKPLPNSAYLSKKLSLNYTHLANTFSEVTGMTIEHYIILHKVERIKELIIYNEKNLTEIAYLLHYSSVSHMSSQFKKTTGLTPSFFKRMKDKKRINLEDL